jgi:adenylate cyclase
MIPLISFRRSAGERAWPALPQSSATLSPGPNLWSADARNAALPQMPVQEPTPSTRKLAAIFAADIAGYSALISADEDGTVRKLKIVRAAVLPIIETFEGRIIDLAGDGILAEFGSAVRAVEGAIAVQARMEQLNSDTAPAMQFRIGINLGDVIHDGERLYGDGINIAARLESIALPGGICISGKVHEEVRGKVPSSFNDWGDRHLKNISAPVRVFSTNEAEPANIQDQGFDRAPQVPEKPSIAVLPFTNMSGDAEQEYFVDGITEDLITELSRFRSLFVIARNSSFVYKGKTVQAQQVARELGVRYIADGSVRKAGDRIRVTAQLIDAASGKEVWAQRFDHHLTDVFQVQNEVVQSIIAVMTTRLEAADLERANRKALASLDAYDCTLRAKYHHHRVTKEDNAEALRLSERAVTLDPNYAQAHAWLACSIGQAMARDFMPWSESEVRRSFEAAETARSLDDNDAECHRILCEINLIRGDYDRAQYHQDRALYLNPNDPRMVAQRGYLLTWLGRADEGVRWIEQALRLDPAQPEDYHRRALIVFHAASRYEEAIAAFSRLSRPSYSAHAHVAACEAEAGGIREAQRHAAQVVELSPAFSSERYAKTLLFKNDGDRERIRAGMLKAGLPH